MKKEEMNMILKSFPRGSVVEYNTLSKFILENFKNKTERNIGFYLFDLTKNNILYQLNTGTFKMSSRKSFRLEIPERIHSEILSISLEYPEVEICVWETRILNGFMEMQLLKNVIYIEVEKSFEMIVFKRLSQNTKYTTLIKPSIEVVSDYNSVENLLVLKTLLHKAPTNKKRFSDRFGYNINYHGNRNSLSTPKIEKILVDLFSENSLSFINESEKMNIFKNSLRNYSVNFKTLFSYAKNRNKKELIQDYINNIIRFDINIGEFYDI
jgi:hypothetical protein